MATRELPPSVTHFGLNALAAAFLLSSLLLARGLALPLRLALPFLWAATALPVIVFDVLLLKVHRRASTGLDWRAPARLDLERVATKLLGLAATLGLVALAYFTCAEYGTPFYEPFFSLLRRDGPALALMSAAYVAFVDARMRRPRDAYWQLGRAALGRFEDARAEELADHFRGWLVKGFFIPLFFVYARDQVGGILHFDLSGASWRNLRLYDFLFELVFVVDVLYVIAGYVLTLRLLDTHLRSAEPTMLGWAAALECYDPFWSGFFSRWYLHYDGVGFGDALAPHPALRWLWAGLILSFLLVYILATVAFGVRFSNLTHRGILTNGPYRFTKHPAYLAKNLSWWLITLPFLPYRGWPHALRSCLALAGIGCIYAVRARTEERHLSRDPVYVDYALWMNENGLFAGLARRLPALRYRPPAGAKLAGSRP